MLKRLILTLVLISSNYTLAASNQCEYAPYGWGQIYRCDNSMLYSANNIIQHFNSSSPGLVQRFDTWIKRPDNTYVTVTVGCLYHTVTVYENNKQINSFPIDPGHPFWNMRNYGCSR